MKTTRLLTSLLATAVPFLSPPTHAAPGDLDPSFGSGGKTIVAGVGNAVGVAVQSDGKIVTVGNDNSDLQLLRFLADGTLDTSFGSSGVVLTPGDSFGESVAIQSDGKIVVAGGDGTYPNNNFSLRRYATNGDLDLGFGVAGSVSTDFDASSDRAAAVVVQTDGKIVAAGHYYKSGSQHGFAIARYETTGILDTTFGIGGKVMTTFTGPPGGARSLALQPDGKIVVAGNSNSGNTGDFLLARYLVNGTLDPTFDGDGKVVADVGVTDVGKSVKVQSDGKIVLAGYTDINGTPGFGGNQVMAVLRFNDDGLLDTSFSGDGVATTPIIPTGYTIGNSMALQQDGKIVVVGNSAGFTSGEYERFSLARFDTDGSPDTTLKGGTGLHHIPITSSGYANASALDADGKILVAGETGSGAMLARFLVLPSPDPEIDVLFTEGTAVPGAGVADSGILAGAVWTKFSVPAIDAAGHIVFAAQTLANGLKKYGIFFVDGGNMRQLAQVGGAVPGAGAGGVLDIPADATFASFKDPLMAEDGSILYVATIKGTGVTSATSKVVMHHSGYLLDGTDEPQVVALTGRPVGQPAAAGLGTHTLKSIGGMAIVSGGHVAISGLLTQDSATTSVNDQVCVLWSSSAPTIHQLALREGSSPGGGMPVVKSFKTLVASPGAPGMGHGWLKIVPATTTVHLTATATFSDGRTGVISVASDTGDVSAFFPPGGGWADADGDPEGYLKAHGLPSMAETPGKGIVRATTASGSPIPAGLFSRDSDTAATKVFAGVSESALDSGGATWKAFKDPLLSLDGTMSAFAATLTGGGTTSANDTAIYWQSGGPGGGPHVKLAREGEPAAEADGAVWKSFTSLAVPGGGTGPILLAKLLTGASGAPGPGGTLAATDTGLWGTDGLGALRLLLREGVTQVDGATLKSFTVLGAVSGAPGSSRSFNSAGQIVVRGTFSDGAARIVIQRVPQFR